MLKSAKTVSQISEVMPSNTVRSQDIKRVGIIGGGQLAWMMADAAKKLGIELVIQTPHQTDPAVIIASDTVLAAIDDASATAELASRCDVITFENEFIDLDALIKLENQGVCFRPQLAALAPLLDKYHQRCYLRDLGLPVPKFEEVKSEELVESEKQKVESKEDYSLSTQHFPLSTSLPLISFGFPVVLKARRHGYDGQGTFILKDREALEATLQRLGQTPVLLEEFIPFERELAVIAARSITGEVVVYPVVETQQEEQVCRRVLMPADIDLNVRAEIEAIAQTLLENLQAVGVFGIELFLTADGKVLVNEISPRTHNSGHYTLDACETSQFEQHLRAVCGLPLGEIGCPSAAVMVNLLGYEHSQSDYREKRQQLAEIPHSYVHWYGKTESRPGRKLGHITVLLDTQSATTPPAQMPAIIDKIEAIW